MRFFRHNRTKMVHCGHVDHSDKTGCGRKLSEAYYLHVGSVDNVYPKCKHCFGALTVWVVFARNCYLGRPGCQVLMQAFHMHEVCTVHVSFSFCLDWHGVSGSGWCKKRSACLAGDQRRGQSCIVFKSVEVTMILRNFEKGPFEQTPHDLKRAARARATKRGIFSSFWRARAARFKSCSKSFRMMSLCLHCQWMSLVSPCRLSVVHRPYMWVVIDQRCLDCSHNLSRSSTCI